jgi:3-oxoacyl-[acyl-carrier-protein] synthase-3
MLRPVFLGTEIFLPGRLARGDLVCLAAFRAGFTWASALLRW